ncbi:NUDIX domain-containing protein [Modestobacter sp. I12A-02628]|uniref:NUDIX hydrolase n=1 Tax=Goekera deserti TaxID=2497753 RepID=A0A7K3WBG5_9ACTN|nr:NUDIX hydrolase [Goekera deserti]MPR00467.1 NUDIX domain-containing protein [Goekera deserti]NDI49135.1 NUDIX domain-containing protein [Goekera deserti]NEL52873.1 NUDIX hydrolase [Goekera deserti]
MTVRRSARLRVGAYAVCLRDGQVLLARLTGRGAGRWTLPGGGIDHGEDPLDAVVREVAEETGHDVVVDALLGVDSVRLDIVRDENTVDHHALRLVYAATVTGGELRSEVGGSTDAAAWVDLAELPGLPRLTLVDVGLDLLRERPRTGRLDPG